MGTIRFICEKEKANSVGLCPIKLIYSVNGERKFYGTGLSTPSINWDTDAQKAVYLDTKAIKRIKDKPNTIATEADANSCNREIKRLRTAIENIEEVFRLEGTHYTSQLVIDKLKADLRPAALIKKENEILLIDFIDTFSESRKSAVDVKTTRMYKTIKQHLRDFQTHTKQVVTLSNIDYTFFESFYSFLVAPYKKRPALENSTVSKRISNIKTILNYAELKNLVSVPITVRGFKNKKINEKDVIALTEKEFKEVLNLDLSEDPRLARVRDIFCFSCATGLRYSDIEQLRREHIKSDEIRLTMHKTDRLQVVPLNKYSTAILNRYKNDELPLPVISNQKLNDYIKEVCQQAKLNEPIEVVRFYGSKRVPETKMKWELISMHKARKTFITLSIEKGMSLSDTMETAGIKDYKTLRRYNKVHEESKKAAMKKAWK